MHKERDHTYTQEKTCVCGAPHVQTKCACARTINLGVGAWKNWCVSLCPTTQSRIARPNVTECWSPLDTNNGQERYDTEHTYRFGGVEQTQHVHVCVCPLGYSLFGTLPQGLVKVVGINGGECLQIELVYMYTKPRFPLRQWTDRQGQNRVWDYKTETPKRCHFASHPVSSQRSCLLSRAATTNGPTHKHQFPKQKKMGCLNPERKRAWCLSCLFAKNAMVPFAILCHNRNESTIHWKNGMIFGKSWNCILTKLWFFGFLLCCRNEKRMGWVGGGGFVLLDVSERTCFSMDWCHGYNMRRVRKRERERERQRECV